MTTRHRTHTESITIEATPDKVWDIITRIDGIVAWYDTWDTVETDGTEEFLRGGSKFRLIRNDRHPVIAECEITAMSAGRHLQWRQTTPGKPTTTVSFELIYDAASGATELRQTRTWNRPASPAHPD